MFVLLILAIRFFSRQSKQDSKTIIIDDKAMNSNHKIEKNSNSITNLSNYQNTTLLAGDNFDDLDIIADRKKWNVTANSWQADNDAHNEGPPNYIIDGNSNTRWHSRYDKREPGKGEPKKPPYHFIVDLNETVRLGGFKYGPRKGGPNGHFKDYKFYTGSSIEEVEKKIAKGESTTSGVFNYPNPSNAEDQFVRLSQEVECSVVALQSNGTLQNDFYAAVCSEFNVYVYPKETETPTESETESPTENKTESPTEIETESPTKSKTDSERESETETGSQNEKETETQAEKESETIIENQTENETKTKSEFDTEIENSSSETEETNINSEKITQTESDKEEHESKQSTDEKDDDQSQPDIQYHTSIETKIVTSIITEEIIHPDEETNSPSNVIIISTNELTSNTPSNTTNVIDNTETELEKDSSIHSEDSTNNKNTALIAGATVGVIVLIIIVILLIIFLIYRHKRLEYNSTNNDFSVEMDDGALNILETNIDTQNAYIHSNQSDITENPFMKDEFIESNNKSDINDNSDSNNVDDSQVSKSNS